MGVKCVRQKEKTRNQEHRLKWDNANRQDILTFSLNGYFFDIVEKQRSAA